MYAHAGTSPHIRVGLSLLLCHQTLDETLLYQLDATLERVVWTLQLFLDVIDSPETGGDRFYPHQNILKGSYCSGTRVRITSYLPIQVLQSLGTL